MAYARSDSANDLAKCFYLNDFRRTKNLQQQTEFHNSKFKVRERAAPKEMKIIKKSRKIGQDFRKEKTKNPSEFL